jgi:hypothetical protein
MARSRLDREDGRLSTALQEQNTAQHEAVLSVNRIGSFCLIAHAGLTATDILDWLKRFTCAANNTKCMNAMQLMLLGRMLPEPAKQYSRPGLDTCCWRDCCVTCQAC